jgi:predicted transport protein
VQRKELKLYIAFKRLKNFATVVLQRGRLLLYLHLDAGQLGALPPIGRDVGRQGHWGTGDVELALSGPADLDAARPFIVMAYEGRAAPPPAGTDSRRPAAGTRPRPVPTTDHTQGQLPIT